MNHANKLNILNRMASTAGEDFLNTQGNLYGVFQIFEIGLAVKASLRSDFKFHPKLVKMSLDLFCGWMTRILPTVWCVAANLQVRIRQRAHVNLQTRRETLIRSTT